MDKCTRRGVDHERGGPDGEDCGGSNVRAEVRKVRKLSERGDDRSFRWKAERG